MPLLLPANADSISLAAKRLAEGHLVAFPTETVYGLGADTFNVRAIANVYAAKGRPSDNPLIAHVYGVDQARSLCADWPETADVLAAAFWPGPLTLVLPRSPHVPAAATGGRATIALRSPRHPVAQSLLRAFGGPISAPSANRSGHVSPTVAAHVARDFDAIDDLLILDGGACELGLESTVVSLDINPRHPRPRILRPGSITAAQLATVIGPVDQPTITTQADSPGTAHRHYAPRTPALVLTLDEILAHLRTGARAIILAIHPIPAPHRVIPMPGDPSGYAARLYAALREADDLGADVILIQRPPDAPLWLAVHDRLARAASSR